ncbi:MAG: acyl-CoA dehydrogenase family protein [Actinomycetota bacterium]
MNTKELRTFARTRVFSSLERRATRKGLDSLLWKKMAEMGILGMPVRRRYGGEGAGVAEFVEALSILAAEGYDLGLTLSVLDHVMLCAYPLQVFGSEALRKRYLPSLCGGELVGAAAVSEPGVGANPSRMRTRAERKERGYLISGEKGPVTNAPMAGLFLVIAVTDPAAGKKGLSAFLLERDDGVRVEEEELGFLSTSPHGRVFLEEAWVPRDRLLGEEGWGHERISRSLFLWERTAIIPVMVAFLERWHHLLVSPLNPADIQPDVRATLAQRKVELTAYRVLGKQLLELTFGNAEDGRERLELLLFFGKSLPGWVESMRLLVEESCIPLDENASRMLNDLRLLEVGKSIFDWQLQNLI